MAQVDQLGSVRVTNGQQSNGGKDASNSDPIASTIEFDGQSYTVGPNDTVVLPIAGAANVSASGGRLRFDDSKSNKKFPNNAYVGL